MIRADRRLASIGYPRSDAGTFGRPAWSGDIHCGRRLGRDHVAERRLVDDGVRAEGVEDNVEAGPQRQIPGALPESSGQHRAVGQAHQPREVLATRR
jgi:hypothetical protein